MFYFHSIFMIQKKSSTFSTTLYSAFISKKNAKINLPTTTQVDFLPNFDMMRSKQASLPILVAEQTFSTGNRDPKPNSKIFVNAATSYKYSKVRKLVKHKGEARRAQGEHPPPRTQAEHSTVFFIQYTVNLMLKSLAKFGGWGTPHHPPPLRTI